MIQRDTTTLQGRLQWILDTHRLNARQLSLLAGLSHSHVSVILSNPGRKSLTSNVMYRLAYAAKVSPYWLATGEGSPDADDTLTAPPLAKGKRATKIRDLSTWVDLARAAQVKAPELDWAIMGVGELPAKGHADINVWQVLDQAERLRASNPSDAEIEKLTELALGFYKTHEDAIDPNKRSSSGKIRLTPKPPATVPPKPPKLPRIR